MLDVEGLSLTSEDADILQDPLVGGVILFARNYQDRQQVADLCGEIRAACPRDILISVAGIFGDPDGIGVALVQSARPAGKVQSDFCIADDARGERNMQIKQVAPEAGIEDKPGIGHRRLGLVYLLALCDCWILLLKVHKYY